MCLLMCTVLYSGNSYCYIHLTSFPGSLTGCRINRKTLATRLKYTLNDTKKKEEKRKKMYKTAQLDCIIGQRVAIEVMGEISSIPGFLKRWKRNPISVVSCRINDDIYWISTKGPTVFSNKEIFLSVGKDIYTAIQWYNTPVDCVGRF